ncbi:hypothetical protein TNCV_2984231 [Trichonephila clavipes]|nr:hypothetical protein TNCV_2984231 [Trichonephila clavipes]
MVYDAPITSLSDLKESIECHTHNIPQFMLLSRVEHAVLRFQMVFIKTIEAEKKTHMVSTYLYSCSDSSNAQPPHDRAGNEIPSPTSRIDRA